jgi:hypothetical protein
VAKGPANQDPDWGKRLDGRLKGQRMSRRTAQQRYRVDKTVISRLTHGGGSLKKKLEVCRELEMATPQGLLSERQTRLLAALEVLRRELEESFPNDPAAVRATLEAFVSRAEAEARKLAPDLIPAPPRAK